MSNLVTYSAELEYARLPLAIKTEVDKWSAAVRMVIEGKPKMVALSRAAEYLGLSTHAVRAKVAEYQKQGQSWRVFIDGRKMPHAEGTIPEEFLEWYLIKLCGGNQRKNRPGHSKLIRLWQQREPIPGYPVLPPPYPGTDIPWGWGYSNLQKAIKKNPRCQFLLTLCRQGPVAASALMPNLCLSTRVGIKPGQVYMPDDRWVDCEVIVPTQSDPCRPIELGFGDFASTKKCCWGIKPQLRLTRKSKRIRTKESDMRLLLAQLLCLIGYHRDGVQFIIEHGTATISHELELILCQLSGGEVLDGKIVKEGLIKVVRSGFQGGTRMLGGYLGKRLGNFKAKASYESSHALYHNETADLQGQTGKDPEHAPEDQARRKNEDTRLMIAMLALRPDLREHVQFGHLHFKAFLQAYMGLKARIEDRIHHRIQDWEECGYIVSEYRTTFDPNGWRPRSELAAMPPLRRQEIESLLKNVKHLTRTRRLSPNEVWDRGLGELTVLPIHCMRLIMGESLMEPHRVQRNGEFVIKKMDLSDTPMHFIAIATDDNGVETVLTPFREYRTWINDFNPDMLFVEEMGGAGHGRYLGICRPVAKVSPTDSQGRFEAVRAGEKRLEKAMAPYLKQGQKLLEDRERQMENNATVFEGGPVTPVERRVEETRLSEPVSDEDRAALSELVTTAFPQVTSKPSDLTTKDFL